MKTFWTVSLIAALALTQPLAEAKRAGGGNSLGKQSSNVTQRQSTQPAQSGHNATGSNAGNNASSADAKSTTQQATPARQQQAAGSTAPAAKPAAAPNRPWGAMLGGLAAGLGLAWLANALGLGEAFANILLFGLLALAVMVVVGLVMRARSAAKAAPVMAGAAVGAGAGAGAASAAMSPRAFSGAGMGAGGMGGGVGYGGSAASSVPLAAHVDAAPQYNPARVGNDASARPWEQVPGQESASMIGAALGGGSVGGAETWSTPADFDVAAFEAAAKRNFIALQAAWDKGDIPTLRSMMTDEMLSEIRQQLAEREAEAAPGEVNQTDVVMLEAQFLGIEDQDGEWMASVEFSGLIREDASAGPAPFREVWNMTKPKNNASGWLVAGLQALD